MCTNWLPSFGRPYSFASHAFTCFAFVNLSLLFDVPRFKQYALQYNQESPLSVLRFPPFKLILAFQKRSAQDSVALPDGRAPYA